jgi:hypothetical protein
LKRGFQTRHAEMDSARLLGDLAKGQATAAPTVRLLREDILALGFVGEVRRKQSGVRLRKRRALCLS